MFNQVTMIGNLTRDPELRYSGSGTAMCNIGLATNRAWKDKNTGEKQSEVCFIDVKFFGRAAEVVNQHFSKGKPIVITGRIVYEQWQDQNGQKRSKHSIAADTFNFLPTPQDSGVDNHPGSQSGGFSGGGQSSCVGQSSGVQMNTDFPDLDIDDSDIPF
jgi:single-strand DNA-binding protein